MNIDMDYIKTEAAKQCYWLKDGVFNLPEWTRAMMQIAADRAGSKINSMKRDLDACRPYLKEGETVADALNRMQNEITTLRNAAMQLWAGRRTFDKGNDMNLGDLFDKRDKQAEEDRKDAARYRWLRMNRLWLKANLPMLHVGEFDAAIDKARAAQEVAG